MNFQGSIEECRNRETSFWRWPCAARGFEPVTECCPGGVRRCILRSSTNTNHADSKPTVGPRDDCRATGAGRALGFRGCEPGGLRLPPSSLHVSGTSARIESCLKVQHGQWRPMRFRIARLPTEYTTEQPDLHAYAEPVSQRTEALEIQAQRFSPRPVAIAFPTARAASPPCSLIPLLRGSSRAVHRR